jgi:hypothetical protein
MHSQGVGESWKELPVLTQGDKQAQEWQRVGRVSRQGGFGSGKGQIKMTRVRWVGCPAGTVGTRALVKLSSLSGGSQTETQCAQWLALQR